MSKSHLVVKFLAALISFLFCPVGLFFTGFFTWVFDNNLNFNLLNNVFVFQLIWIGINSLIYLGSYPKLMIGDKDLINSRFSWIQIGYLLCAYLYYSEGNTPTEKLNRYIDLFIFCIGSIVLEIYLDQKTNSHVNSN